LTRAEGDLFKGAAIFAQRNFIFRASIDIIENDSWQPTGKNLSR
jgi:hypothetical protein